MSINGKLFDSFLYFIQERDAIRLRRLEGKPKPWSEDKILQAYRFCNIDREQDTVTIWIRENIREPYAESPSLWFNLAIARFINLPETMTKLGYLTDFDERTFMDVLDFIQAEGEKLFGNAYMIRAGTGEDAGKPKHHYLADRVFRPMWKDRASIPKNGSCAEWSVWFRRFFGMGDFMRNQIITDMKYTRYLRDAPDYATFCLAGPGTTRGLNRLYDRPLTSSAKPASLNQDLLDVRDLLEMEDHYLLPVFRDLNNLSNSFCEFDKYQRVLNGEGRPKQGYPGL